MRLNGGDAMKKFKVVQVVEEVYIIEAEDEESAVDMVYSGHVEPTRYGYKFIDSVEEEEEQ